LIARIILAPLQILTNPALQKKEIVMKKALILMPLLLLSMLLFTSCKDKPTQPAPDPDPTFSIASVDVLLDTGDRGIQFFATSNEDVLLVKAEIKPPVGNTIVYNLNSGTFINGQSFTLQADGTAYFRISGSWTFTFTGNKALGTKKSFVVTTTLNVGA
jgi:hypothetical protein